MIPSLFVLAAKSAKRIAQWKSDMTEQEIFTKVCLGLASQGFLKSMLGFKCGYRGYMGRKCSVGHLIPDDKYHPDMEGRGVARLDLKALGLEGHLGLLIQLEYAHDDALDPYDMRRRLSRVARDFGLMVPNTVPLPVNI